MIAKRNLWTLAAAIIAVAFAAHADVAPPLPDEASNKEIVIKAFTLLDQGRIDEAIDTYWGDPYTQHNPNVANGREALRAFFKAGRAANPKQSLEIKRVIAEGDLVVVHFHAKNAPEDRGMAGVDIVRMQDGKLVEHWDVLQPVPEKSANTNTMF